MKTPPPDIDCQALSRLLQQEYGIPVTSIGFVPKGEDSYNYVVETRNEDRWFVRAQPTARAGDLESGLSLAWALQHDAHLPQVLAAVKDRRGRVLSTLGGYTMVVFPFLDGTSGWEEPFNDHELGVAASVMAQLHRSEVAATPCSGRETFEHPFEAPILGALEEARRPGHDGGSLREDACCLVSGEEAAVRDLLASVDRLGIGLRQDVQDFVYTHGDPNAANWVRDRHGGLRLVDWGEGALGPPERDLTAFTGDEFEVFLARYARAGGRLRLRPAAFEFYFYRWTLQEIADYSTRLLFSAPPLEEQEHAWAELHDYLPIRHRRISESLTRVRAALRAATAIAPPPAEE